MTNPKKTISLLGSKISDVLKITSLIPVIVYRYRRGNNYVFNNAPFASLYVENDTIAAIDGHKESRYEKRYKTNGIVFAAPNGNTDYTIVGDLINISYSAIRIRPYAFNDTPNCIWKLYIDIGNVCFDVSGSIIRMDDNNIVFRFLEYPENLKAFLLNLKNRERHE